jgi:hypothetical protein
MTAQNDKPITENIMPMAATATGANTASHECTTPNPDATARNTTP